MKCEIEANHLSTVSNLLFFYWRYWVEYPIRNIKIKQLVNIMEFDKQPKGRDNKQEEANLIWIVIKDLAEEKL